MFEEQSARKAGLPARARGDRLEAERFHVPDHSANSGWEFVEELFLDSLKKLA